MREIEKHNIDDGTQTYLPRNGSFRSSRSPNLSNASDLTTLSTIFAGFPSEGDKYQ